MINSGAQRGISFLLVAFLILAFAFLAFDKRRRFEKPGFVPEAVDFGSVVVGDRLKLHSRFVNNAGEKLLINGLDTSCACTEASFDRQELSAGQFANLDVRVSLDARNTQIAGTVIVRWQNARKTVEGRTLFKFTGENTTPAVISPLSYNFGRVSDSEKVPHDATFKVMRGRALVQWDDLQVVAQKLECHVVKENDDTFILKASLLASTLPIGPYKDHVDITLLNQGVPLPFRYSIPIVGEVRSDFEIIPNSVYLGVVPVNRKLRGAIEMHFLKEAPRVISAQSTNSEALAIESTEHRGNLLIFHYKAGSSIPGNISGMIQVTLQGETVQNVVVPFIGYARP